MGWSLTSLESIIVDGNNVQDPIRYINEAFADFVSGQVTSIANYKWLSCGDSHVSANSGSACYDENFTGFPASSLDTSGIARIASLIHDVFDGQTHEYQSNFPDNADAWMAGHAPGRRYVQGYVFTNTSWGEHRPPAELFALPARHG